MEDYLEDSVSSAFINPLYLSYKGSDIKYFSNKKIKESKLWFITFKDNTFNPRIYDQSTPFSSYVDQIVAIEMPDRFLKNKNIRSGLIDVGTLNGYFSEMSIVYLMANMTESEVRYMIKSTEPVTLNDLITFKKMEPYTSNTNRLFSLIKDLFPSYWNYKTSNIPTTNSMNSNVLYEGIGPIYKQLKRECRKSTFEFKDHSINPYDDNIEIKLVHYPNSSECNIVEFISDYLNEYEKKYFIKQMTMSNDYCHYALDPSILPYVTDSQLAHIWLLLCRDQASKYNSKAMMRYWLDIDMAKQLPFDNPEIFLAPLFLTDYGLKPVNKSYTEIGLCDQKTITERINLFLSKTHPNILDNMDWNNVAITGSAMSAVIPLFNPLYLNCNGISDYFDKYYGNADVDIVCQFKTVQELITQVLHINDILPIPGKITTIRSISIYIEPDAARVLCETKAPFTYEYLCDNRHENDVKEWFYQHYVEQKNAHYEHNKKVLEGLPDLYQELLELGTIDDMIINISRRPYYGDEELKFYYDCDLFCIREVHRYKLESPCIRTLEIFKATSIPITVQNFHLPCVRAYYTPETTKLTAHAITAYITGWNININYYASSRKPMEIISKYHKRGFGIKLTGKEFYVYIKWAKLANQPLYLSSLLHSHEYYDGIDIGSLSEKPIESFIKPSKN